MSPKVAFIFGIHNHQPIGNFGSVFEEAYAKTYAPFLEAMARHPSIRWNLHATGILWEWLERNHPGYLDDVRALARKGGIELLSGGFYEPILPVIPDEDKVGQIKKLNAYILDRFGQTPKGMWCAERVWEPHLPKPIREAGIEYTVLDDMHFLAAGLGPEQLHGYYRVEEQNHALDVFPISQEARYTIPFAPPEATIELLGKVAAAHARGPTPVLVMADDGEKFGFWPKTHELIYGEKWLDRFLTLLEKNSSWIEARLFSEYRREQRPLGKAFLPTSSYFEMSEWALPSASSAEFEEALLSLSGKPEGAKVKRFLKGGIWRNFLAKYPEAESMYKKMLRVSSKVHAAAGSRAGKKNGASQALDHLWAGQCNCAYWHGVFGGLYLPILRQAIYQNLIEAEKDLDALGKKKGSAHAEMSDYDSDGSEEAILETTGQNLYFAPERGGALLEWDFKPAALNVANVLTRRPEAYHRKLQGLVRSETAAPGGAKSIHDEVRVKESGLADLLTYDWYRRACLIDHFLHPGTTPEGFRRCQYGEQGDFVLGAYRADLPAGAAKKGAPLLALSRRGGLWSGERKRELDLEKAISIEDDAGKSSLLRLRYRLSNPAQAPLDVWFAPEFNFAFSVPEPELDKNQSGVTRWERKDRHLHWALEMAFSKPADLWLSNLETVSNSEGGFERTFQGLTVLPQWKFSLPPGGSVERTLQITLIKSS